MSASTGTLRAPRRAGAHRVTQQVLEVVLVLAITISAIVVLATLREPTASVAPGMKATGFSDIDARWTPKWRTATELRTRELGTIVDTRWTAKTGRAEALKARGR